MANGGMRPGAGRKPGIPNKVSNEMRTLAQQFGPAAIRKLAQLAGLLTETVIDEFGNEVETPLEGSKDDGAVISATKELLNRAYGQSTQLIAGDTEDGKIIVNLIKYSKPKE